MSTLNVESDHQDENAIYNRNVDYFRGDMIGR